MVELSNTTLEAELWRRREAPPGVGACRRYGQAARSAGPDEAALGLPAATRVVSCYEAGRDGFWLHRQLRSMGVENDVVDSSSIEVWRQRKSLRWRFGAPRLSAVPGAPIRSQRLGGQELQDQVCVRVWLRRGRPELPQTARRRASSEGGTTASCLDPADARPASSAGAITSPASSYKNPRRGDSTRGTVRAGFPRCVRSR